MNVAVLLAELGTMLRRVVAIRRLPAQSWSRHSSTTRSRAQVSERTRALHAA